MTSSRRLLGRSGVFFFAKDDRERVVVVIDEVHFDVLADELVEFVEVSAVLFRKENTRDTTSPRLRRKKKKKKKKGITLGETIFKD